MLKLSGPFLLGLAVTFAGSTAAPAQSKPIDVTLGWNYACAGEGPGYASLNGWYGTLIWEASSRIGISFVHESFWGPFQGGGTNQHSYLFGPNIELRKGDHKVNPSCSLSQALPAPAARGASRNNPPFNSVLARTSPSKARFLWNLFQPSTLSPMATAPP